jgi:heme/copper-type cytochrome/quinol oxidase subunit 2
MPIVVKAVSKDKYKKWLKEASIEFSSLPKVKNINLAKK